MRYGIIGIRDYKGEVYDNYEHIVDTLNQFSEANEIITGGSKGCEDLAEKWAKEAGVNFKIIRPKIKQHGAKEAFRVRNAEIAQLSDELIIFWDGVFMFIPDTLSRAMLSGIPVHLFPVE